LPDAIILPMFPKTRNWKINSILLFISCVFLKPDTIIGRSVLSTKLALIMREKKLCKNVIYDGRGAITAEWTEYKVIEDKNLLSAIGNYERDVILYTDYRIAVSKALSDYWKVHFNYTGQDFVNIPCTINSSFQNLKLSLEGITSKRHSLNYNDEDIILVYSGSLAGWQSFKIVDSFVSNLLLTDSRYKVLFLSKKDKYISDMKEKFPGQVRCIHLLPEQVPEILQIGDYGILIRERSITNSVASPVKYAEYLSCGLKVIISEGLGDYSKFTLENNCGLLFDTLKKIERTSMVEKIRLQKIAHDNFTKDCFSESYLRLFS
jgi:hypothetical protein